MKALLEYIKVNKDLIDDCFIIKHPSVVLSLYYSSTHRAREFKREDLMDQAVLEQHEVFDLHPSDFAEIKSVLGV